MFYVTFQDETGLIIIMHHYKETLELNFAHFRIELPLFSNLL